MYPFEKLEPVSIWKYFYEIFQIPRPSKKEEKIIDYLKKIGQTLGLDTKSDKIGNVLISKPGTKGKEDWPIVVLQSHVDMVCEKNSDTQHNFNLDPIIPFVEDGWVKARGTTLGADDGIGIAAQLALLASKTIEHGPLECLFTVDEETGLTGAFELQQGFFKGKTLINLDSEDEGELFIGCAGGIDTIATFDVESEILKEGFFAVRIDVSGLKGGHSGDDINKGLACANKILVQFLDQAEVEHDLRIATIDGGNLRNAIAREAYAIAVVPMSQKEPIRVSLNVFFAEIQHEYKQTESKLKISLQSIDIPKMIFSKKFQSRIIESLMECPHGVIEMSREMAGMVETSTNLASVKIEGDKLIVTTSQRSSVESAKTYISKSVASVFELAGATVVHSDGYPGWAPNVQSKIMAISKSSYIELFKTEPIVRAIHAGLECGLFLEKYPDLDMVSFGPTIRGAHSPDERINIETVRKFWDLLIHVLQRVK